MCGRESGVAAVGATAALLTNDVAYAVQGQVLR